jgi:hypothetical protein
MASYIGRRKFLATLGGAAVWLLAARAQQVAMPVIEFFTSGVRACYCRVSQRLHEVGCVEGHIGGPFGREAGL